MKVEHAALWILHKQSFDVQVLKDSIIRVNNNFFNFGEYTEDDISCFHTETT